VSNRDNADQRSFLNDEHQEALLRNLTKRLADVEAGLHALETWQQHAAPSLGAQYARVLAVEQAHSTLTQRVEHLAVAVQERIG
jgi:hypothetical protein